MRVLCSIVGLSIALLANPAMAAQEKPKERPPKYKLALTMKSDLSPVLFVNVTISKKHVNRHDLLGLAEKQGRDFSNQQDIWVFVLDDHRAAKLYHPGVLTDDPCWDECRKALRATYHFDRSKGEHYIELYLDPNDPEKRKPEKIELGPPPVRSP